MLAAIVERPHEFVIKDIPRPDAGPKQVIIKTLACSICNATDNHILEGFSMDTMTAIPKSWATRYAAKWWSWELKSRT